jgi:hypothetical protein
MDALTYKTKLNSLFSALRKRKIVARQMFMCCTGCGCAQLGVEHEKGQHKGKAGWAFYNKQCAPIRRMGTSRWTRESLGAVPIGFGTFDKEETSEGIVAVGRAILEEATRVGLKTEWDGTADQKVTILPEELS